MTCPVSLVHILRRTLNILYLFVQPMRLSVSLLEGLSDLLSTNMYENKTILENVFLYGTVDLNFDTILSVFNLFQKYINESGRFK